jgi:hypothetical protein
MSHGIMLPTNFVLTANDLATTHKTSSQLCVLHWFSTQFIKAGLDIIFAVIKLKNTQYNPDKTIL